MYREQFNLGLPPAEKSIDYYSSLVWGFLATLDKNGHYRI
jgi:hypothetical protein